MSDFDYRDPDERHRNARDLVGAILVAGIIALIVIYFIEYFSL